MSELILMSGGMDSAMLLYALTMKEPRFLEPDYAESIDVAFVDCGQPRTAVYKERQSFDSTLAYINGCAEASGIPCTVNNVSHTLQSAFRFSHADTCFRQAPAWLFAAFELSRWDRHRRIHVGYLRNDDIAGDIDNLRRLWDMLCQTFMKVPTPPKLCFTLFDQFMSKIDVLEWYEKSQRTMALYNTTWVCETPLGSRKSTCTPCGICGPCSAHRAALFQFKIKHGRDFGYSAGTSIIKPQPLYPDITLPGGRIYWDMVSPGYMHVARRASV